MLNFIYRIKKIQVVFSLLFFIVIFSVSAQTHVSVPLDHRVYYLLEMAETRGLCPPLPAVKPYTRAKVIEIINEILSTQQSVFRGLSGSERRILEEIKSEFEIKEAGADLWNGIYRFNFLRNDSLLFSGEAGAGLESVNSVAHYRDEGERYIGTDTWGTLYFNGDIGRNFSFFVGISAGLLSAERNLLGDYYLYASESTVFTDETVDIYSQPLAFFPYTYQKGWDGFMFDVKKDMTAGSMESWPGALSVAPRMLAEMAFAAFDDTLLIRIGRVQREWGAMTKGSSLIFNASARPFVGFEFILNPISWFSISSITGVLEFDNANGISEPALTFQNAFSLTQFEFNFKNYIHVSMGSSAIWAKRLELGYIFPLIDNFFYQNFIGDFDNMAIFMNFKGQYPGLGKIWFSFFMDEVELSSIKRVFDRDQHMFAYQAGLQVIIPLLPFASFTASYTKIEPYNYTHLRVKTPWYDIEMEQAYVNNGVSLGHYLPPNSDEIKLRFEIHPMARFSGFFQYQLIRHGADFGPQQVDGSSLYSELDPDGRGSKASLKKSFLNDGAYQWMHIIKAGGFFKFNNLPLTIFGEAGIVNTYFTEIDQYTYINTYKGRSGSGSYFKYTALILTIGIRIFL